jgi:hypothetical protein
MPDLLVRSFAPLLLALQSCFTQPASIPSRPFLRLDSLLRPPLPHAHHPIRTTHPVQALLFTSSLLQPSPLESRRSGPLRLPTAVTFLCRGFSRRRR